MYLAEQSEYNLEIQELAYEKGELSRTLEELCEKVRARETKRVSVQSDTLQTKECPWFL